LLRKAKVLYGKVQLSLDLTLQCFFHVLLFICKNARASNEKRKKNVFGFLAQRRRGVALDAREDDT
jgi:hypothetical protein